jgi:tetratricopeptide (TPR) repeat protein
LNPGDDSARGLLRKAEARVAELAKLPAAPPTVEATLAPAEPVTTAESPKLEPTPEPPAPEPKEVRETPKAVDPPKPNPVPMPVRPVNRAKADEYHKLGRQLLQQGKYADAIAALTEALRLAPNHVLAYNARGYARLLLKQAEEAVADFNKAIELNPNYANAYRNRSAARRQLGDVKGATEDLAKEKALLAQ